jgi:methylthioribose-1-phosphate isomerase
MLTSDDLCSLRWDATAGTVAIIDQTLLPHTLRWCHLDSLEAFCHAIASMQVRGAPLIGITAAFGLANALSRDPSSNNLEVARAALLATRPTAVNLHWALRRVVHQVADLPPEQRADRALDCARLATIQWGTALAPIYKAHAAGMPVHVWVSETRPRNQGTNLTAWELQRAGVPCTVVADNSCAELMRRGQVDCVLVGSDRTAANGDVCNKVGTCLKALAAREYGVPFYVALPLSTVDMDCPTGGDIPIEERDAAEVLAVAGLDAAGETLEVNLAGAGTRAFNPAFDITPAALVSALVTERGVVSASQDGLSVLLQG